MRKVVKPIGWLAVIILTLALIGCSGPSGGAKVKVPELGLTMELPPGWKVDRRSTRFFFDKAKPEDNYGLVEDYPLEGKTLDECVDANIRMTQNIEALQHVAADKLSELVGGAVDMPKVTQTRIASRTDTTIDGHEAIELVTESAYTIIEVDIKKGNGLIRISFRTLNEDFPKYEPSFRKAIESIRLR